MPKVRPFLPKYKTDAIFSGIEGAIRFKVAVRGMHQYVIEHSGTRPGPSGPQLKTAEECKNWRELNLQDRFARIETQPKKVVLADYKRFHIRFSTDFKRQFGTKMSKAESEGRDFKEIVDHISPQKRSIGKSTRSTQKRRFLASCCASVLRYAPLELAPPPREAPVRPPTAFGSAPAAPVRTPILLCGSRYELVATKRLIIV